VGVAWVDVGDGDPRGNDHTSGGGVFQKIVIRKANGGGDLSTK